MGVEAVSRLFRACFWAGLSKILSLEAWSDKQEFCMHMLRSGPSLRAELAKTLPLSLECIQNSVCSDKLTTVTPLSPLLIADLLAILRFLPRPWGRNNLATNGNGVR